MKKTNSKGPGRPRKETKQLQAVVPPEHWQYVEMLSRTRRWTFSQATAYLIELGILAERNQQQPTSGEAA